MLIWWFAFHMCCYYDRFSLVNERKEKQEKSSYKKSSYKNSKKTFRIAWTKQIMCIFCNVYFVNWVDFVYKMYDWIFKCSQMIDASTPSTENFGQNSSQTKYEIHCWKINKTFVKSKQRTLEEIHFMDFVWASSK